MTKHKVRRKFPQVRQSNANAWPQFNLLNCGQAFGPKWAALMSARFISLFIEFWGKT
ncbi:MAG: hypothetical protein ACOYL6_00450 [Bacteriovoracaceae bacterium]